MKACNRINVRQKKMIKFGSVDLLKETIYLFLYKIQKYL